MCIVRAPVPLLHLCNQFIRGELSSDDQDQTLDDVLRAVHIQEAPDDNWETAGIHLPHKSHSKHLKQGLWLLVKCHCRGSHLLDINLDVFLQVVSVQVEDKIVDKIKPVTDDDERQLVSEFGFLCVTN